MSESVNNPNITIESNAFWKETTKMAAPQEILDDMDFAQSQLMASDMSTEFKKRYVTLMNISREATNGITPEEKIQKMTEAIALLATTQVGYMFEIQNKIRDSINIANKAQCRDCAAMKHTKEFEKDRDEKERFRDYLKQLGINPDDPKGVGNGKDQEKKGDKAASQGKNGDARKPHQEPKSWSDIMKELAVKPYLYVTLCLLIFSPYSVDIIKAIGNLWK